MNIVINPAYLVVAGLVYLYLFYKIRELKRANVVQEKIYVDRSGIESNPPVNFIDVESNRTINFKVGGQDISICHLPWMEGIGAIKKIATLFTYMKQALDANTQDKREELSNNVFYANSYRTIVALIYELAKPHAKNKRKLKKALLKKSKDDTMFIIGVCQEIVDYWRYMGKLIALLAKGTTVRETVGSAFTWKDLNPDNDGKILIKQRFVPCTPTHGFKTKKQETK